uniref:Uncharacterized protein n=1 Tax=Cajanus cajan TaxID=3821 RepID=A0A151TYZ8_CAJCA|nr:hypothetical protein KK1_004833 [Cajanus cajan]
MESTTNHKNGLTSFSCSVKLDRNNYMLWQSLLLHVIKGKKMYSYISVTNKQFTNEENKKVNLTYEEWIANDQQLLGWLFNSMTHDIATQLLHYDTLKKLWEASQSLAGAQSRSRVMLLKSKFHCTRKVTLKTKEYLIKMRNLADNLKLVESPISTSDLIVQTLFGLDNGYNAIVIKLSNKLDLTWIGMQAQFIAFENMIELLSNLSNLTINTSTNIATRSDKGNRSFNNRGWRGEIKEAQEEDEAKLFLQNVKCVAE